MRKRKEGKQGRKSKPNKQKLVRMIDRDSRIWMIPLGKINHHLGKDDCRSLLTQGYLRFLGGREYAYIIRIGKRLRLLKS